MAVADSGGTAAEAEAIRAECVRHGDEAVVTNVAAEYMAQEYTRSTHPTAKDFAERTKAFVLAMCSRGAMMMLGDGQINGVAEDGTAVMLGHVITTATKRVERKDWERVGAYLYTHPLPENW